MEKLCTVLATKITSELKLNEEKKQVIQYGIFAIIQMIISVLIIFLCGMLFGVAIEALIIMLVASTLRKYSGGAHATTPVRCLIIGTSICLLQAILVGLITNIIHSNKAIFILGILIYLVSYYMIKKYVPVGNAKKQIKSEEKKMRMKKGAKKAININFLIILVLFIMIILSIRAYQKYIFCIYMGIVWQLFTITNVGHKLIYGIDSWFDININFFRKETNYEENE